ncbi:MAG: thioesterase family protein [Acetobacteraceae bacterium]|nr:thioesterase family protein [Acetobacteraceae bacterium]
MIKLFGRMIPAATRGLMQPRLKATDPVFSQFRVLPHDIDINLHLNNGRYMQIIDVNRMEFLLRTGVAQIILNRRWKPILGSTTIQFRRELRLWEQAIASTRLIGWDTRWVYLEHRIETLGGRPVAIAMAKAGFRCKGAWVSIESLRAALPFPLPEMVLPAHVDAWRALDDGLAAQIGFLRESRVSAKIDDNPELAEVEARFAHRSQHASEKLSDQSVRA